jgi:hypothetical protein
MKGRTSTECLRTVWREIFGAEKEMAEGWENCTMKSYERSEMCTEYWLVRRLKTLEDLDMRGLFSKFLEFSINNFIL